MRKTLSFILAAILVCSMLASCAGGDTPADTTTAPQSSDTTTAAPVETTVAAETTTDAPVETTVPAETTTAAETTTDAPDEKVIEIGTAEELYAFADSTALLETDYDGYTIKLTADISLSSKEWTPMTGSAFFDTTFDGQGHTISDMNIVGKTGQTYLGFISSTNGGTMIFENLTFDNCSITAYGKECGFFIGQNNYCELFFKNVKVTNSKIDGYMDYSTNSSNIAFRVAAFVGGNWKSGSITIDNCAVSNFTASGFHNLAAFVGYDSAALTTVTNSTVDGMTLTFSYCMASSYTVDQEKKYVSLFYNLVDWPDVYEESLAGHNTYSDVKYVDYTTGISYLPENFRTGVALNQG